ncbi:hypothetical protein KC19_5G062100 [Ceratodon purpureus]|uniref:Uncharacterized protein n=1 Tax=Ceratodon purpureus TaxID=3225 RepID=A0A8T0HYE8_CERPU|nr:hypothetical protein KC19_5G062100 [Ceratodon purpureus]
MPLISLLALTLMIPSNQQQSNLNCNPSYITNSTTIIIIIIIQTSKNSPNSPTTKSITHPTKTHFPQYPSKPLPNLHTNTETKTLQPQPNPPTQLTILQPNEFVGPRPNCCK